MLTGFTLTNVALFLNPMSPEDFLGLAFSDPLLTILDTNGSGAAVFFWISLSVMLFGLLGLLSRSLYFHRVSPARKPSPKTLFN
jgi:hypothetical protein